MTKEEAKSICDATDRCEYCPLFGTGDCPGEDAGCESCGPKIPEKIRGYRFERDGQWFEIPLTPVQQKVNEIIDYLEATNALHQGY